MSVFETVVVVLALVPSLLGLWNLFLFRRPKPGDTPEQTWSILIPARDEAARLPALLDDLLADRSFAFEVVVLDDQSSDGTDAIVEERAIEDQRLRLVRGEGPPEGWNGKQAACWRLANEARHERLLFLDADLRLEPGALARLTGAAERSGVDLFSGFPRIVTRTLLESLLLPLIHYVLLAYLPFIGMRRTNKPSFGAGCGQVFATTRAAYFEVGGHEAIRESRHDGVRLPRLYRTAGRTTDLADLSTLVSTRMYRGAAEVWRGLQKNASEGLGGPIAIWVWTVLLGVGSVAPWILLAGGSTRLWSVAAAGPALRLVLGLRLRQSLLGALTHPLGVLGLLVNQWQALWLRKLGRRSTWRGRVS